MKTSYTDCVFINCPFDEEYAEMFRANVFTVLDAGFIPRCSRELGNGTSLRLTSIVKLMEDCKYGVHDLSRVEPDRGSQLPRFNMPFELGLFYAAKHFGARQHKTKRFLIFEKEAYRYQKFISDIAGLDVTAHAGSPDQVIVGLRDWLVTVSRRTTIPRASSIKQRFTSFTSLMAQASADDGVDHFAMPFVELVYNMTEWLRLNQVVDTPLFAR